MSGQGNRPVDITLPDTANPNARASIPDHAVGRVAAAMRRERGEDNDERPDDEYVADTIMVEIRERVAQHEYSEAIRAAHQSVQRPEPDF